MKAWEGGGDGRRDPLVLTLGIGWMVNFTPPSALSPGKEPTLSIVRVVACALQLVLTIWQKGKSLGRSGGRTPNHPDHRLVTILTTSLHDNMLKCLKPSVA